VKQEPKIHRSYYGNLIPEAKSQNKDDAAVWDAFKTGNESAFIYIYETYFDQLFVYGNQFARNEDIVKDAIQDLFIALRKTRSRLGRTDSIKFYLYKSLKRLVLKESRQWFNQCEELDNKQFFDFSFSHEQVLIERQLDEEKTAKLNRAIKSLPPRKREVIYYFYYEGMSYQQIQELMDLSHVKSARNLLYQALDFLRQQIK
jgi:RNA polymerase sigma factor (sigma-70 family)